MYERVPEFEPATETAGKDSRGQVNLKANIEQGISNYEVFGFTLRHLPAYFFGGFGSIW